MLYSFSVVSHKHPPWNTPNLLEKWDWTHKMVDNSGSGQDELYCIESKSKGQQNFFAKIYLPNSDRAAQVRAQREYNALKLLKSNKK